MQLFQTQRSPDGHVLYPMRIYDLLYVTGQLFPKSGNSRPGDRKCATLLFSINTSTSGPIPSQKMRLLERRILEGESNVYMYESD